MASTNENIEVVYNSEEKLLIILGDNAVELTHDEGIQLLQDLAAALQEQYNMREGKKNIAEEEAGI